MCGIIGVTSSSGKRFDLKQQMKLIVHRGPDDIGDYYSEKNDVQLGQVRLSIIDTSSAGHQPMYDHSGRYIMVYNGEIYNYRELKKELDAKYGAILWKSSSDSEVIIEGFAREGVEFFEKLNGIFAIMIYDSKEELLHVLRDPIGIKPLYYTSQLNAVFFCSELKGILGFDDFKCTVRQQSLADQLAFMYVPEPYTMYNEFFKVERGVYYVYRNGQKIKEERIYNHLHDRISFSDESNMLDCFQNTFSKAISRQLISDVPVSLFLSGGVDSSAVAYESIQQGANIHSAYTISFSKQDQKLDGQGSDLFYAQKIAKQLGLNLKIIEASSDFMGLLPDLMPFLEDGISDPAAINTYLICKSARADGIKVMLSGQGADEYLCGYRRYIAEKYLQNMPLFFKQSLVLLANVLPNNVPGRLNSVIRRLKRLALSAGQNETERMASYFMWDKPARIQKLFKQTKQVLPGNTLSLFLENHQHSTSIDKLLAADQQFDLLALNLAYSDKMSMAVGVETRVPFLDFELVKLMNSLPDSMKIRGNVQKYILKKSMEGKLPNEVIYRSKAGFSLPIRSWFNGGNKFVEYYFDKDRLKRQDIFNVDELVALYKEQCIGKKDNSYVLFAILCQQIWLDQNL